jgi:hypothetical protein
MKRETLFSSILLFGKYRMYRNKIEEPVHTPVLMSTLTQVTVMTAPAPAPILPMEQLEKLVPVARVVQLVLAREMVPTTPITAVETDLDGYAINRKLLYSLNMERGITSDSGNVNGVYAMNILIKDIVDTPPQHILTLGSTRMELNPVPELPIVDIDEIGLC